jgi:predicted RNase H-like HicB family nuclease
VICSLIPNKEGAVMSVKVTVLVQKEENWYVAKCLENSIASQGKNIEEALSNLKEAIALYYENKSSLLSDGAKIIEPTVVHLQPYFSDEIIHGIKKRKFLKRRQCQQQLQ